MTQFRFLQEAAAAIRVMDEGIGHPATDRANDNLPKPRSGTCAYDGAPTQSMHSRTIEIAVALLSRNDGRTLVVRKRGTVTFIQPGGKIEPGETPIDALCRELAEELGLCVAADQLSFAGRYEGPAVNEPDCSVVAHAFYLTVEAPVTAAAEIEELVWLDPSDPGDIVLAPLTRETFLPLLLAARA